MPAKLPSPFWIVGFDWNCELPEGRTPEVSDERLCLAHVCDNDDQTSMLPVFTLEKLAERYVFDGEVEWPVVIPIPDDATLAKLIKRCKRDDIHKFMIDAKPDPKKEWKGKKLAIGDALRANR